MSPDLPREIWILITQFLPDHTLWKLRSLNSAFFQAAMDAHYRVFSLFECHMDDRGMGKTLRRWKRYL
jgi:hypothetical protein